MTPIGARTSGGTGLSPDPARAQNAVMRAVLILVTTGIVLAGCGNDDTPLSTEDRTFIDAVVALRQAAQQARGDETLYAALKVNVLSSHRVTEEELRAYIQSHAQDLDRMAAVWESINVRLTVPTTQE